MGLGVVQPFVGAMALYTAIAICGSMVMSCSTIPQIYHLHQRKSALDVSYVYQVSKQPLLVQNNIFRLIERSFNLSGRSGDGLAHRVLLQDAVLVPTAVCLLMIYMSDWRSFKAITESLPLSARLAYVHGI